MIAPGNFGIPEMVLDGVSGYHVAAPPRVDALAEPMIQLSRSQDGCARMRGAS